MKLIPALLAAALALCGAATAQAAPAPTSIDQALAQVKHPLIVNSLGELSGDGATLLKKAIGPARFIAVGEDHFTREIPLFVSSLCDLTAKDLGALALEVGPRSLKLLEPALRSADREKRFRKVFADYPNSVAFLDSADDNVMAAHCLAANGKPGIRLIGADQEFLGATGLLLDRALKTKLSPAARGVLQGLRERDRQAELQARSSGDFGLLPLLSWKDADWSAAAEALRTGGNPEARDIIADLRESSAIYALNGSPTPDLSNERRAKLLKRNLVAGLPDKGKVIFKFGDWHLYKGFNPLRQRDLGNFIAEYADMRGEMSLHILVLGARGVHAVPTGFAKPLSTSPFVMADDRDYHWFKAAADNQISGSWTLFDLRPLRFAGIAMDQDWRRVVDGYDLLIVIPELTPAASL